MNVALLNGLYGGPPPGLIPPVMDVVQLSPLMPGALVLENYPSENFATMTILAPPGTLERRYIFARALQALAPNGTLTAVALKEKGGHRMAAELATFGCTVTEESRRHYRLCTTHRPPSLQGIVAALAEGGPQKNPVHGLWTQPGIFSWDRIDSGSVLLLQHLPKFSGRGADLGCGLGILSSSVLASPDVAAITLMDNDRRAVAMAERNIRDPRAAFIWADVRESLPLASLDFVVMNPPFHTAGMEDQSLGQAFITRASALLKQGGKCWLTANRHLPYEALLAQCFTRVECIIQADGFKIYAAEK